MRTLILLLILVSCYKPIQYKGKVIDASDLMLISKENTSKMEFIRIFGSPSFVSYNNSNKFYYYSYTTKQKVFFKPKIENRKIFIATFDEKNILKDYQLKTLTSRLPDISKIQIKDIKDEKSLLREITENIGTVNPGL